MQLINTCALGYQELTGQQADYVEIYELDERKQKPCTVDEDFIDDVKSTTRDAAHSLRTDEFPSCPEAQKCKACDYRGLCAAGQHIS